MATARDLCFTPAVELLKLYRTRKVSPLEVMQAVLARIDAVNPAVNAIVTLAPDAALREARRATASLRRGSACRRRDRDRQDQHAGVRLRPEHGEHGLRGDAQSLEPRADGGRIEWRLGDGEGTDLGGSLRGPASYCGVVGFRTTSGLIPRHPSVLAWDTYSVEGPMARTVADAALMLSAMAGIDERSPLSYEVDARDFVRAVRAPSVKGWRIAWTPDLDGLMTIDDDVRAVVERAVTVFRGAGARVEQGGPDLGEVPEIVRLTRGLLMVARHADKLPEHRAILQPGLVENTEQGLALTPVEVARGELLRTRLWQRVREFLSERELLITPTSATPPFSVEQAHVTEINGRPVGKTMQRSYLTYAFSVLGLPAISIPCGFTRAGLPVGLQIVGKRRGEAAVLRAAAAFEAARPWAPHVPPIVARRG